MTTKEALEGACGARGDAFWEAEGLQSLNFEDPSDVNSGGTVTIYGNSGIVRLELSLPVARAVEVMEYVVRGTTLMPVVHAGSTE